MGWRETGKGTWAAGREGSKRGDSLALALGPSEKVGRLLEGPQGTRVPC